MRNQIAMAGRLGPPRRDDQLGQHGRVGRRRGGARGRRDRRPADLARAPRQRGVREPASCPRSRARSACSSSTRRTASRDWGHDFRPDYRRIGADPAQRSRRRSRSSPRRRPPTTGSSRTSPSSSGEGVADHPRPAGTGRRSGSTRSRSPTRPSGWRGSPTVPAEPARQRHRLLPDRRRHAAGRHLAALAGHRRPCLQRGALDRGARGARGRADRRRDEGARRDGRARDGLRQAGPRLRRPLPAAGLGRSPTTSRSGRAGRAVDSRLRASSSSGREDDEIAEYFIQTAFPPTVNMEEILETLEAAGRLDVGGRARSRRSTCRRAGSSRRSSCSRSTARWRATAAATRGRPSRGRRTRRASSG